MAGPKYKRVLLKLSGEAFCSEGGRGLEIDPIDSIFQAAVFGYTGDGTVDLALFNTLLTNQVGAIGNGSVGTVSINVTSFRRLRSSMPR